MDMKVEHSNITLMHTISCQYHWFNTYPTLKELVGCGIKMFQGSHIKRKRKRTLSNVVPNFKHKMESQNTSFVAIRAKMGFYSFFLFFYNFPAFFLISQNIQKNSPILKLDFLKIEFQMQNSIFGQSSYSERGLRKIKILELEFLEWNSSSSSKKKKIIFNSV